MLDKYINKIIHGDCLEIMKRLPDNCIDLVVTDIPYNVVNRKSNGLRENINKGIADSAIFDIELLVNNLVRSCGGSFYIFCATEQVSILRTLFVRHGLSTRHGYWEKDNPVPMNGEHIYLSAFENVIYAKKSGATFNGFCIKPKWNAPIVHNQIHPTQKPLKVIAEMIKVSSKPSDLILDPFSGSGTTAVACYELGRRFIGIEKELKYVDIANERLKNVMAQGRLF